MKYYITDSMPLSEVTEERIGAGDCVYNELGQYVKKVYQDESVYFVDLVDSVLNDGEVLSELTQMQLGLFWALSRTKRNKYNELKNKRKRNG